MEVPWTVICEDAHAGVMKAVLEVAHCDRSIAWLDLARRASVEGLRLIAIIRGDHTQSSVLATDMIAFTQLGRRGFPEQRDNETC